jgi:hypothetical protein
MRMWGVVVGLGVLLAGGRADAGERCMWGGSFYDAGAMSCQAGAQARCVEGRWTLTGSQCAGAAADPAGEENEPGATEPPVVQPPVE